MLISFRHDEDQGNKHDTKDGEHTNIKLETHYADKILLHVEVKNRENVGSNIHEGSREEGAEDNGC